METSTKSYLVAYSGDPDVYGDQIMKRLDEHEKITNWRLELARCFFVVARLTAKELSDFLLPILNDRRYIVTQYVDDSHGLLSEASWNMLNNGDRT